jgi:hypothetical protein
MKLRIVLALLVGSPAAVGCFQTIDNGVVGGPPDPNSTATSSGGAVAIGTLVDAGLPDVFAAVNVGQQCEAGSSLCYQLCNSPECATSDGSPNSIILPPVLQTPAFLLADGGESTDPCTQLEAESIRIRKNSCSQCHSTTGAQTLWTWVMDDTQLVTNATAPNYTVPLVISGNPGQSVLLQKMNLGLAGNQLGMPPADPGGLIGPEAGATVVHPTPEDVSLMYAWILACAPNADAGSYQTNYGGGAYGPEGGSTVSVSAKPVPAVDAGH